MFRASPIDYLDLAGNGPKLMGFRSRFGAVRLEAWHRAHLAAKARLAPPRREIIDVRNAMQGFAGRVKTFLPESPEWADLQRRHDGLSSDELLLGQTRAAETAGARGRRASP